jgi:hypothetical protein
MSIAAKVQLSFLGVRNGKGLRVGSNTVPDLFGKLNAFGDAQLKDVFESERRHADILPFFA